MRSASSNGPRRPPPRSRAHVWRYVCPTWTPLIGSLRWKARTRPCSTACSGVLTLAFDTATSAATIALVRDEVVLGEAVSRAIRMLEDADQILRASAADRSELTGIVVGTGPGSFTGLRMGLAAARGLAFALELPVAGVSTLAALAAGAPGATPVVDAGRR